MKDKPDSLTNVVEVARAVVQELSGNGSPQHLREIYGNDLADMPGAAELPSIRAACLGLEYGFFEATLRAAVYRDAVWACADRQYLLPRAIDGNLHGLQKLHLIST